MEMKIIRKGEPKRLKADLGSYLTQKKATEVERRVRWFRVRTQEKWTVPAEIHKGS